MTLNEISPQIPFGIHTNKGDITRLNKLFGLTAFQIFMGSPRSWAVPTNIKKDELKKHKMPIFIHSSYLVNPASFNPEVRKNTLISFQKQLDNGALAGAKGVVIHGGQGGKNSTIAETIERWVEFVEKLNIPENCPILIENTAGGGAAPGRHMESFTKLMKALQGAPVGYCVDTCHSWAGGFGLDDLYETLMENVGFGPALLHMNGSKDEKNSGRDHHSSLIEGEEQTEKAIEFANLCKVPVILETPGGGVVNDMDILRRRLL